MCHCAASCCCRQNSSKRPPAEASAPAAVATVAPVTAAPVTAAPGPALKPLTYAERIELETLLDRVGAAEGRVAAAEAALSDPAIYVGGNERSETVRAELEGAREEARTLTERWEALELRREATAKK